MTKVLMVSAENGAFVGGKVGGMGDVIRDLPPQLAKQQIEADVIMPSYGRFAQELQAQHISELSVSFAGQMQAVSLYRCDNPSHPQGQLYLLDHPLFASAGVGRIYDRRERGEPFAVDASKFALFCAGVAKALCDAKLGEYQVLHLHDWHTALLALLRQFDPRYRPLQGLRCVFSIHNLAHQGPRPYRGSDSSLEQWFPELLHAMPHDAWAKVGDPRYRECLNPMRCGINLSDKVHLVSPSYAEEVLLPSHPHLGYYGGEGLQDDLSRCKQQGKLTGILNGLTYPDIGPERGDFNQLLTKALSSICLWQAESEFARSVDLIAHARINQWQSQNRQPSVILSSVARLTEQKAQILCHALASGKTVLETLLFKLKQRHPNGVYLCLGSGSSTIESQLQQIAARHDNFLFLNGYQEELSAAVYQQGQLFLMPSSFEPCGLSQLMAMREGQPCLVHHVGGLKDTVEDGVTGFAFQGKGLEQQGLAMLRRFDEVMAMLGSDTWQQICANAKECRFDWQQPCAEYKTQLYGA